MPSKTQVQSSFSMSALKNLSISAAALYCPPLKPLQLHRNDKPPKADSEARSGQAEFMIQGTSQFKLSTIPTLLSPQLRQTRLQNISEGKKHPKSNSLRSKYNITSLKLSTCFSVQCCTSSAVSAPLRHLKTALMFPAT